MKSSPLFSFSPSLPTLILFSHFLPVSTYVNGVHAKVSINMVFA